MTKIFDNTAIRSQFPAASRMLYLDSAHQTPLCARVRAALEHFFDEGYETAGPKPVWLERIEVVRGRLARFIGAGADEIAYTKNTSEGLNIAANAIDLKAGDNVLMIEGDHPNNAYAWLNLKRKGIDVRFIKLETDIASADTFTPHIDSRTRVISLSHVTFHAGQRHDIASIGALCKSHGLYLVVDAMQSVGVLPVDVKAMGVSMLAAGCHKGLLVPQGLGFLYVDKDLDALQPAYLATAGLAHPPADFIARPDDLTLRSGAGRFELGNFNLPDIHALGASLSMIDEVGADNVEAHVLRLGDRLLAGLDELGIGIAGPRERKHRAHIYVMKIPRDWLPYFEAHNVRVSPERDGIRVSFGLFNNENDVDALLELLRTRMQ
ncbi:Cysteine desulfurase [Ralstonia psammae]|uniref:Cysteine desulfurase n=1 Tax=Ralstonia psammae TaxID=3058598 RepID=A0ABM9J266_9RALS|nr:aminotransferase class V-fold PLP-dependent enzyme [Ralstonia sp. LMG 19083]CAJ0780021.1 Cysteine desulfurase [Ralstonia sp. LMG 19083]